MADEIRVDISQLQHLAQDLMGATARLNAAVVPVVKRGATNIKNNARARIQAQLHRGYAPAYPYSISFDIFSGTHLLTGGTSVVAEIGPDKDKAQGALGNLIEYGSANNAPLPHLQPAAREEEPRFQANLIREAVRAMVKSSHS